jgi:hypothetical protein
MRPTRMVIRDADVSAETRLLILIQESESPDAM